ncbi:hypothetical protein GWK47_018708 [Chionoecetes opilio]|uniref:Uncharacterized protein n=1 Tax=Chionoecetes opilio TaxID=41210 RepID=A0A8J5CLL7_CHIOP|nr:hypothetical protein GWK47_018708 [Chionoecetes opilio]
MTPRSTLNHSCHCLAAAGCMTVLRCFFAAQTVELFIAPEEIEERNEMFGVAEDGSGGFKYSEAPERGGQEGVRDFTHKVFVLDSRSGVTCVVFLTCDAILSLQMFHLFLRVCSLQKLLIITALVGYQKWHEFEPGHPLHDDPAAS